MYKIAITGKANTGKNTLSKLIKDSLNYYAPEVAFIAFADPLKEMIRIMFPQIPKKFLYGSSKFRKEIIPRAFKDGNPLTIRQLLIDLGTGLGRGYNESVWLDNFDNRLSNALKKKNTKMVIVTDVRFRNEFDHLKNKGFYMVKLTRGNNEVIINHASETSQEDILDSEFDYIIDNNGTLQDLKVKVTEILQQLSAK